VMYADETIWCTQDAIQFVGISDELPLMARSTIRNIIISMRLLSVGYRVNSIRATQFR